MMYDPPAGWLYGFPKPFNPLPGESLRETLIRDGYPPKMAGSQINRQCRFIGSEEELRKFHWYED